MVYMQYKDLLWTWPDLAYTSYISQQCHNLRGFVMVALNPPDRSRRDLGLLNSQVSPDFNISSFTSLRADRSNSTMVRVCIIFLDDT